MSKHVIYSPFLECISWRDHIILWLRGRILMNWKEFSSQVYSFQFCNTINLSGMYFLRDRMTSNQFVSDSKIPEELEAILTKRKFLPILQPYYSPFLEGWHHLRARILKNQKRLTSQVNMQIRLTLSEEYLLKGLQTPRSNSSSSMAPVEDVVGCVRRSSKILCGLGMVSTMPLPLLSFLVTPATFDTILVLVLDTGNEAGNFTFNLFAPPLSLSPESWLNAEEEPTKPPCWLIHGDAMAEDCTTTRLPSKATITIQQDAKPSLSSNQKYPKCAPKIAGWASKLKFGKKFVVLTLLPE